LLDERELARLARFARGGDRRRYLAARALTRLVLASRLGCEPAAVRLRVRCAVCGSGEHGKPFVEGGPGLSYSHAGDRVVVAVSGAGGVGVDVENPALIDVDAFDALAVSDVERSYRRWDRASRTRSWVRKEAALKAAGVGLTIAPSEVEVSAPDEPPALIRWPLGGEESVALLDLELDGYPAAVAVRCVEPQPALPEVTLRRFEAG